LVEIPKSLNYIPVVHSIRQIIDCLTSRVFVQSLIASRVYIFLYLTLTLQNTNTLNRSSYV